MIKSEKYPDQLKFPERVKRTRFRPEGNGSVLSEAVVVIDSNHAIHAIEIAGTSTYQVSRFKFLPGSNPGRVVGAVTAAEWEWLGKPETWDEDRVKILLGLAGTPSSPFRIAVRTEGTFMVAYLAPVDTMDGATKIAVVHRAFFDLVDGAFERFKADLASFSRAVLAATTDVPIEAIFSREQEPPVDA